MLKRAVWLVLGLVLLSVPLQLLYPRDTALPFYRVGGLEVGSQNRQQLISSLDDFANNGQVSIATPSKQWQAKWQDIGLTIDREASADAVLSYPIWERLVPMSSFIKVYQSRELPLIAIVDNERLNFFAEQLVAEDRLAASDATISVQEGKVVIDEAKNGYQFVAEDVKMQIQRLAIVDDSSIYLTPELVPFVRSESELEQLKAEAETILAHKPVFKVADKTYSPEREIVGGWLRFAEDQQTKKLSMQFNHDAIKEYLQTVDNDSMIAPGTSMVTLLDGQEVARTRANSGRSVAIDGAVDQVKESLLSSEFANTVELKTADVPPKLQYVRTYSSSSDGLLAIIRDWDAQAFGDYGVIVREIDGQRRYAQWQPDKKYVTASTFKMFVAYVLLKKIQEGSVSYSQVTDMGWTVDACLTEMIVNSTNPCAVSLLNLLGWAETQKQTEQAGFTSTLIDNGCCEEKHSTVRDETNFLLRLHAGTLLDTASTDRLLGLLKRQVWRGGIPSGVPKGVVVADKVGFYAGYMHDVAIVYAPKGTYILGVMSYGGSNPNIAELSRRIYTFFQN